jgi:hypothetical protein
MQNSCKNCIHKSSCDVWKDKQETTPSGWDKNRFGQSCREFKEK